MITRGTDGLIEVKYGLGRVKIAQLFIDTIGTACRFFGIKYATGPWISPENGFRKKLF